MLNAIAADGARLFARTSICLSPSLSPLHSLLRFLPAACRLNFHSFFHIRRTVLICLLAMLACVNAQMASAVEIRLLWAETPQYQKIYYVQRDLNIPEIEVSIVDWQNTPYDHPYPYLGDLTIPAQITFSSGNTYTVTRIGKNAFDGLFKGQTLRSIKLPNTIRSIGNAAFASNGLEGEVELPEGVREIGEFAFHFNFNITSFVLPATLSSIGQYAFGVCPNLKGVYIKATTPPTLTTEHIFDNNNKLIPPDAKIYVPAQSLNAYKTAPYWSSLKDHIVPMDFSLNYTYDESNNTATVGDNTNYTGTTLTIPQTTMKGDKTYRVTAIGARAFSGRTSLERVTLPEGLTEIGDEAFNECWNLTTVNLPSTLRRIGNRAFYNTGITGALTFPEGFQEIGDYAFYQAKGLTSISLPSTLKTVGNNSFRWCPELTTVRLAEGVTSIGFGAFLSCGKLTNINFPSTLKKIGERAFYANNIKQVTLPDALTDMDYGPFYDCVNLAWAGIHDKLNAYPTNLFYNCQALSTLQLRRPFGAKQWNTLCLPRKTTVGNIKTAFGSGSKVATFDAESSEQGLKFIIRNDDSYAIEAGTPFLIKPETGGSSATISVIAGPAATVRPKTVTSTDGSWSFIGTFALTRLAVGTDYFIGPENVLYQVKEGKNGDALRGFRGYFRRNSQTAAANSYTMTILEETTGIGTLTAPEKDNPTIYDLQGRPVGNDINQLPKGIYIRNGKKVMK